MLLKRSPYLRMIWQLQNQKNNMKIISPHISDDVAKGLLNDLVALVPTDTVYGLAALPSSKIAVEKVYKLKQRSKDFNLPIMVSDPNDLNELGLDINENAEALLNSPYMPGAITLVLGFSGSLRPTWLEGRDEVAVRIPNHKYLLSVLSGTGPLLVTSANKHRSIIESGTVSEILEDLNGSPDIIVDAGSLSINSSTIVNCRYKQIIIEREGQISKEQLQKYLGYE